MPRLSSIVARTLLLLAMTTGVLAQQYGFRHYGNAEGLENLTVLAIAQDGPGYLWVGTEGGLYRYDGTRFRRFGKEDGLGCAADIRGLTTASDGALWVDACVALYRFDGKRFQPVTGVEGNAASGQRLTQGSAPGQVLFSGGNRLYEISLTRAGFAVHLYSPGVVRPRGVLRSGDHVWYGCGGGLCRERGGTVISEGPKQGLPDDSWEGLVEAADGTLWARSSTRLMRRSADGRWSAETTPSGTMFWGALSLLSDGTLLAPTDRGLALREPGGGWSLVDVRRGLKSSMAVVAFEDRGGQVWVGLGGGGLARWLGRREWQGWSSAQGLPSDLVWSIHRDRRGSLWVGTSQGLARFNGKASVTVLRARDGLGGDNVRWIGETPDGVLWVVTRPGGVSRVDPASGAAHLAGQADGFTCGTAQRGWVDGQGRTWIATACGLYMAARGAAKFTYPEQPESLRGGVWSVAADREESLWATGPGGLWRLRGGQWKQFGVAEGVKGDAYIVIPGPDGALYLRHRMDAGIERLEVTGDRITASREVVPGNSPDQTAFHGFDSQGRLWRGTPRGASVLSQGVWTHFTAEDGLIGNDCDGEAFAADADGSVWIGTSSGLAHYTPDKSAGPPDAEPVITGIDVTQRLRVARAEFSCLRYKYDQAAQFSYRLDGGAWIDTPERSVSMPGFGPGKHKLEVRMRLRDGKWLHKTAVAGFEFHPQWMETWWVRSLMFLFGGGLIWAWGRWRNYRLERHNEELADAVRERTAELEAERLKVIEEKRRADQASRAKGDFLAQMSHEIRTPLNGVIGLSNLLEHTSDPEEIADTVRVIRSSATTLLGVVNDVLDFSKIEAGKLEVEFAPFSLHRCLKESIDLFRPTAVERGIEMRADVPPELPDWVSGDGPRLRQVVLNLVSNALKFTHAGSVVLIARVEKVQQQQVMVGIHVRDTGIGIPPDRMERLFNSFSQADPSISRRYGGTGLGLVISKRLVELMGGSITVESIVDVGTCFHLFLPMTLAEAPAPAPAAAASPARMRSLRVLVAEDNPVNQKVVIRMLQKLGVDASIATDGFDALSAVKKHRYDLVLMDLQMPEMDGLEATREIRKLPAHRQPVIVGLTAYATAEHREICREAGMDGYLSKPIEAGKLHDLLNSLTTVHPPEGEGEESSAGVDEKNQIPKP